MNPVQFFVQKHVQKWREKSLDAAREAKEAAFQDRYRLQVADEKTRVCLYQTGFTRQFTRFYTSTPANQQFGFTLVDKPEQADVVVFLNTVDSRVLRPGQNVVLFFHEPLDYAHRYQTTLDWDRIGSGRVRVVSHLPSPALFITNPERVEYLRSIPYVHFHHGATSEELDGLADTPRKKLICSVVSGFSGVPGYQRRREFIESFASSQPRFDLYGRLSKEAASLAAFRGGCARKWHTLGEYRYNLVIENATDDYYISEKIFDALICGCLPVYHGSERIFELLPEDWFYYLPRLDASEIPALNRFVESDAYQKVASIRASIAQTVHEKFSFYSALDRLLQDRPLPVQAV